MPEITFTIENIIEKAGKNKKIFHVLRNNGDGYFVWDSKLIEGIEIGDTVKIEHDGSEYPKVKTIEKLSAAAKQPVQENLKLSAEAEESRRISINKAVALKEARAAYGEIKGGDDVKIYADNVCTLARMFERWLNEATPKQ